MCKVCGFELWLPTHQYPNSTLGLYNDARFPGRSILKLNEHYTEFESLPQKLLFFLHGRNSTIRYTVKTNNR